MEFKEKKTRVWTGTHKGVSFEINNFKTPPNSFDTEEKDNWTYYLFLHLDRIPEENKPKSYWLKGKKNRNHIHYDYYSHGIINSIELSGGCTWYSKEHGFDGASKVIKIGCDYQHSWNIEGAYSIESLLFDVKNSIDSFIQLVPNYKYWCCGNGKLYTKDQGKFKGEQFYSKEYYGDKEFYKALNK